MDDERALDLLLLVRAVWRNTVLVRIDFLGWARVAVTESSGTVVERRLERFCGRIDVRRDEGGAAGDRLLLLQSFPDRLLGGRVGVLLGAGAMSVKLAAVSGGGLTWGGS